MNSKGWKRMKLGQLVEINARSITNDFSFEEIEYIDTSSVTKNRFEHLQKLKFSEAPSRAKRIVQNGDTIFSTVRPIQRHLGFIKNARPNTIASTGFVVLTPKKIYPEFLYYYLSQDSIIYYLNGIAETTTTTFPAFRPDTLADLEVEIPDDIQIQHRIASILSALDEKIELNHQTNATLEAIAQAIFKEWFVDFHFPGANDTPPIGNTMAIGPASSIAKGDRPVAPTPPIGNTRMIPKGWRLGKLGDIYETASGGTPSRKKNQYYENGVYQWAKSKELNGSFIITTEEKITDDAISDSSAKLLPKYSVLIAMYGATVGQLGILSNEATTNQSICAFIPSIDYPFSFIYQFLKYNQNIIVSRAVGSAQQNISQELLRNFELILPDISIIKNYHTIVAPLLFTIEANIKQAHTLASIRDALLPKLMRGEIDV